MQLPTDRKPGAAFAISLGAITLIGPLSIHLFLPAMPDVKADFGISSEVAQLTFSVTLFAMAIVTPFYGSLSDRYGRRSILLAGLVLFLIGSLFAALAQSVVVLIAARFVQAMGAGCGMPLTRAIARDAYGPGVLVKAIAYLTMAYTVGPMLAPPLGGLLIDAFGWRSEFWFALSVGAAITIGAYFVVHETRSRADIAAAPPGTFRHYGILLRDPRFLAFVLQSGFTSFMFFAIASASPFLMKDVLGRSATEYGLYFMLFPTGYFIGNVISSRLSGRAPIEKMVLAGALIGVVVVAGQSGLILAGYLSPLLIFIPGGLLSFAQGLSLPNAQAGAMRVQPALAGTAAGLGVFVQMLASAISTEVYGLIADGTPIPMIEIAIAGVVFALLPAIYVYLRPSVVAVTA